MGLISGSPGSKTLAAINGFFKTRLKRNHSFLAALRTDSCEKLAFSSAFVDLSFSVDPAVFTSSRLILKPFFGVELLLSYCENKILTAIFTHQRPVFKHDKFLFLQLDF